MTSLGPAAFIPFLSVLGCVPFALAEPPHATITWRVDGGEPVTLVAAGETAPNGNQFYTGEWTSPDGSWYLSYMYTTDWRADPVAKLQGQVEVKNFARVARVFEVTVDVPISPTRYGGSLVGGAFTLSLNSFQGQGVITCPDPDPCSMVQARTDGRTIPNGQLLWCPFNLITDSSGHASTNGSFGTPIPSAPGPWTYSSIGIRQNFSLSDGDYASLFVGLTFKGTKLCLGDITGDGAVGPADLASLLGQWGDTFECWEPLSKCDLNGDQAIDATDLALLLSAWECPFACSADLSQDGTVGAADLALILGNWNGAGVGDLNEDGVVDALDLTALLGAWGLCPGQPSQ